MSIQIAPVVMAAMAGASSIMAIRALANGDYAGALMAGMGAVAGFSAFASMSTAAGVGAATAGVEGVGAVSEAATGGMFAGVEGANIGATLTTPELAMGGLSGGAEIASGLGSVGSLTELPSMATSLSSVAQTGGGGFLDSISSGFNAIGDVGGKIMTEMGEMTSLGDGTFQAADGSIFDQMGNLVKVGKSVMDTLEPALGYMAKKNNSDDMLKANKDARDQARADVNAERSRRGYVPPSTGLDLTGRSNNYSTSIKRGAA